MKRLETIDELNNLNSLNILYDDKMVKYGVDTDNLQKLKNSNWDNRTYYWSVHGG